MPLTSRTTQTPARSGKYDRYVDRLARCRVESGEEHSFIQSTIKEHAELFLLLCMINAPGGAWGWRESNLIKEIKEEALAKDPFELSAFSGYPVLPGGGHHHVQGPRRAGQVSINSPTWS